MTNGEKVTVLYNDNRRLLILHLANIGDPPFIFIKCVSWLNGYEYQMDAASDGTQRSWSGVLCNARKGTQCTSLKREGVGTRCSWFDWLHIAPQHLVKTLHGAM